MADYNRVQFEGRCNYEGKQADTWYRNNLSVYQGKDKEGKGQYFNVSFFLNADQFDLIPAIENKETIRLVGGLKVEKYVGKDGTPAVNLQVAYPDITLVSKDANINDTNEISPLDDYSDDMEPF